MAISKTISYKGETREITINGSPGAEFELYVKQGSNYYNWDTNAFQPVEKILKFQEIPSNGIYTKNIVIPKVTANTSYDFYINILPGTTSSVSTTHTQKIGTLFQKGVNTATFTTTSSASLVIASGLTGGTLNNTTETLFQAGTITKSGSPLIYVHETPSWDIATGGNWTLSNNVKATIVAKDGAKIDLDDATGIASGYSVFGNNIIDEITVSAISGNKITLSVDQNLKIGQVLSFSKSGWTVGSIIASLEGSGTTSVTMKSKHKISKIGIAALASVCSVDSFVSVKPNAFPMSVDCPAKGEVFFKPSLGCVNYLGQLGDNDANQATKVYTIYSIPADATSSRATIGEFGTINLAADEEMGSAGAASVTYTAHANMVAGDTDYFYYDCVDSVGTASATDQGKISITII